MKVLVYGAGVIGQIYGGRLARSGHDVSVLARGRTAEVLAAWGITLRRGDECWRARPAGVGVGDLTRDDRFDVVLVTVRLGQIDEVVPDVARLAATRVAFLLNRATGLERTASRSPTALGRHRTSTGYSRRCPHPELTIIAPVVAKSAEEDAPECAWLKIRITGGLGRTRRGPGPCETLAGDPWRKRAVGGSA